jgi:hypothetical protein
MTLLLIQGFAPLLALGLAGVGSSLLGSVGKMFGRDDANKQLSDYIAKVKGWKINPAYEKIAAETAAEKNARMRGAAAAERNIYQSQANAMSDIQRGATDPNQVILNSGNIQGQTNTAFENLQQQEESDFQNRSERAAQAAMAKANAEEQLKQQQLAMEAQLSGAIQENKQNTWGDIAGLGGAALNIAAASSGGFENLFGKGKSSSPTSIQGYSPMEGINTSMRGTLAMPPKVNMPSYAPQLPYTPSFNFQQYPQQGMGNAYYNTNWFNPNS